MVKFAYTILYVPDVALTIAFYENAFGFTRKFITPENDYGELLAGDTTLAFASIALANTNLAAGFTASSLTNPPFGFEIGFTTDHVEDTLATAVQAGATIVANASTKPWGQTVAYIRDPNGFLVEICTAMGS